MAVDPLPNLVIFNRPFQQWHSRKVTISQVSHDFNAKQWCVTCIMHSSLPVSKDPKNDWILTWVIGTAVWAGTPRLPQWHRPNMIHMLFRHCWLSLLGTRLRSGGFSVWTPVQTTHLVVGEGARIPSEHCLGILEWGTEARNTQMGPPHKALP